MTAALPLLRGAAAAFETAVAEGRLAAEVLPQRYSEAAWVLEEYGAYLAELSADELRDVLSRRAVTLLARRGFSRPATFESPDGSFALAYDRAALMPLPDEFDDVRDWLTDTFGGQEGPTASWLSRSSRRRGAAGKTSPWRRGRACSSSCGPTQSLRSSCDARDWQGDRAGACEYFGRLLAGSAYTVDTVKPATIAGLPAVRTQCVLALEDGTAGLVDNVWVRGEAHIYTLIVWAPDQRGELARAVYGALGGFAPAGCPAAREAGPPPPGPQRDFGGTAAGRRMDDSGETRGNEEAR